MCQVKFTASKARNFKILRSFDTPFATIEKLVDLRLNKVGSDKMPAMADNPGVYIIDQSGTARAPIGEQEEN